MFTLFEGHQRRERDRNEIDRLLSAYGPDALRLVREWASSKSLSKRSRKHWRRIAHKLGGLPARSGAPRPARFALPNFNADDRSASSGLA